MSSVANSPAGIDWKELASVSTGNVSEFDFFCRLKQGSRDKNYCNIISLRRWLNIGIRTLDSYRTVKVDSYYSDIMFTNEDKYCKDTLDKFYQTYKNGHTTLEAQDVDYHHCLCKLHQIIGLFCLQNTYMYLIKPKSNLLVLICMVF